jgi:hypothetical protein
MLSATAALALATVQRPIGDFLSAQGKFCYPDDGGCLLFVPPDPNFLGWTNDLDSKVILFAGVDYAGLANAYTGNKPELTGTVSERPMKDGRAEVTVLLHTKNANAWVIKLDLSGDVYAQIANKGTLFGHRPRDVLTGAGQALANTFLQVRFINTKPGDPLPDLVQLADPMLITDPRQKLEFIAFSANATGPLTALFGVSENTPGACTIVQTGLSMTEGKGLALQDAFPAEDVSLRVIGK